jgi:hypothetical protein
VLEVRSFSESMALLTDDEVEMTSRDLMARFGPNAPRVWQQVLVRLGGSLRWFENSAVERDDDGQAPSK